MSVRICLGRLLTRQAILLPKPYGSCKLSRNNTDSHTFNEQPLLRICHRHATSGNNQDLGTEIYCAPLSSRIRNVKLFSLATSLCGIMVQPLFIQKVMEEETSIATTVFSGVIVLFFTFVTPLLLHYITKKYVRVIYFNAETNIYTALTYNLWALDKLISFKADDVVVPEIPLIFTSIVVKGTPLMVEASCYHDVSHYKRLMGFDKPIDFKLEEKPPNP